MKSATTTIPNATPCWSSAYGDYVLLLGEDGGMGVFCERLDLDTVRDAIEVTWEEVQLFVADWAQALGARAA